MGGIHPAGGAQTGQITRLAAAFPKGFGATIGTGPIMRAFICVLMLIAGYFLKFDLKSFIPGFLIIFLIAFISMVIAKQAFISKWGISYVLFALAIGLIFSDIFKCPKSSKYPNVSAASLPPERFYGMSRVPQAQRR
jgi:hypothetical protein